MNDLLCDALKDDVSYFYTTYHEVHNAYGRATITYKEKEMILRKRKTCMPPIAYMN